MQAIKTSLILHRKLHSNENLSWLISLESSVFRGLFNLERFPFGFRFLERAISIRLLCLWYHSTPFLSTEQWLDFQDFSQGYCCYTEFHESCLHAHDKECFNWQKTKLRHTQPGAFYLDIFWLGFTGRRNLWKLCWVLIDDYPPSVKSLRQHCTEKVLWILWKPAVWITKIMIVIILNLYTGFNTSP